MLAGVVQARDSATARPSPAAIVVAVLPRPAWVVFAAAGVASASFISLMRASLCHRRRLERKLAELSRAKELLIEEQARRAEAEKAARALTHRLITVHEDERSRVARELHDDVTQRLARLAIDAAQAERDCPPESRERWGQLRAGLVRLSEDVHTLAYRLHPSTLDELGLVEALRAECSRFARQKSIPVGMKAGSLTRDIPRPAAVCLFRIAQESLQNVARHARAGSVEVSLRETADGVQLTVRDNGIGFGIEGSRPRLGHASMRERIRLVDGELTIESSPGSGTSIIARVPLPRP